MRSDQRILIGMIDGFDLAYANQTPMPHLNRMMTAGFYRPGEAIFPTLTNVNNISIACGAWPADHGVTTNCYFDEQTQTARFLESADFLQAPTLFTRAARRGINSALLTCKSKTTKILGGDAAVAIAAEEPSSSTIRRYGRPPPMYSSAINYWLFDVAIDLLETRPDIGFIYVHTTDYPMHMWAPDHPESRKHLAELDARLGAALSAAPDAAFLITADHGMNPKTRCWDLNHACRDRGLEIKFAISPVADRLTRHHRGYGGVSYVYLKSPEDATRAVEIIGSLAGVETVLTRHRAAAQFRLMAERIGDLVVIPDRDTVFGRLDTACEPLDPSRYRNHGSLYERDIPLIAYQADGLLPETGGIRYNLDLTRRLFR